MNSKKKSALWTVLICFLANCTSDNPAESPENPDENGLRLVWSDEFNGSGLPAGDKWTYDRGGGGWGNNELQYYTAGDPDNARMEGGNLIIEARRENFEGNQYTSARLVSRGRRDWLYGRFEVRAKLPVGRGTWPAIWMLPTASNYGNGRWPDTGEIDIMEHVGHDPGVIHATVHNHLHNWPNNTQRGSQIRIADAQAAFHTYAMEWSPDKLDFFVDDTLYFTYQNDGTGWRAWPYDRNFHLILNIAVGGNWGGAQGVDNTIFPARMEIDFVRVYELQQ